MNVEFDPDKDRANVEKHGVSLHRAEDIDIALVVEDARFDYGETRYRAFGFIGEEAYCLVFTVRDGTVRAISLRRASDKEMERYVGTKESRDRPGKSRVD